MYKLWLAYVYNVDVRTYGRNHRRWRRNNPLKLIPSELATLTSSNAVTITTFAYCSHVCKRQYDKCFLNDHSTLDLYASKRMQLWMSTLSFILLRNFDRQMECFMRLSLDVRESNLNCYTSRVIYRVPCGILQKNIV